MHRSIAERTNERTNNDRTNERSNGVETSNERTNERHVLTWTPTTDCVKRNVVIERVTQLLFGVAVVAVVAVVVVVGGGGGSGGAWRMQNRRCSGCAFARDLYAPSQFSSCSVVV